MESGIKVNVFENISLLYEDNHIIVCIKPEGVLSQADRTKGEDMVSLIKKYLVVKYEKPGNAYVGLVHRLDKRVSGVMVFAKTSKAASRLAEAFRTNAVKKTYYAVATGNITTDGTLKHRLKKVNEKTIVAKDGKDSTLDYKVLSHFTINKQDYTLVKVDLHTGRFNQIRAQFGLFKHPLINDYKYGYKGKSSDDYSHIGLFCVGLSFTHPVTKQKLTFAYDRVLNRSEEDWVRYFSNEVSRHEK